MRNAVYASPSAEMAAQECDFFFNQGQFSGQKNCCTSAMLTKCSLLLIKPHILQNRQLGRVLDILLTEGAFELSALQLFFMNKTTACEFFEVYKGVVPEFNAMTDYIATGGPIVACEVRQEEAVSKLRRFCGPHDPSEAKVYHPNSLRAQFGQDKVRNGFHCTDLPEDGLLECEYFFVLLQQH
jgi:nucleoside-diphosphate kinase